jgi:hypothetical protein
VRNARFAYFNKLNLDISFCLKECRVKTVSSQTPLICNSIYHKVSRSVSTVPTSEPSLHTSEKEDKFHQGDRYVKVPDRGLIELHGDDTVKFLQGLITNNMPSIGSVGDGFYAAFLNPVVCTFHIL